MPEDQKKSITKYVLKLLAYHPRTISEIRTKLSDKDYEKAIIEEVIQEMIKLGYLNDQEYAQDWLASQLRNRPCGKSLCYKKLKAKGLNLELITKTLDATYSHEQELEIADQLAKQKRKVLKINKPTKNQESKIAFYLKNKGFADNIIYDVLQLD